jgi:hypothetical protein
MLPSLIDVEKITHEHTHKKNNYHKIQLTLFVYTRQNFLFSYSYFVPRHKLIDRTKREEISKKRADLIIFVQVWFEQ